MSAAQAAPAVPTQTQTQTLTQTPPDDKDARWYEPAQYARTVTTVVTRSCITSKVLFGIWMVVIVMGAIAMVMVSPVYALGFIIAGVGFAFVILMNYDMACKLGYERFMQIAFGFILLGMVIMSVSSGSAAAAQRMGPAMLTPAMVASKTIQTAHRVRMAAASPAQ